MKKSLKLLKIKTFYRRLALLIACSFPTLLCAQQNIPLGSWRSHFSYRHAQHIVKADQRLFCATDHSLFYLDLEDNSLNPLTKSDGLSDVRISAIAWDSRNEQLLIGYRDGNLDILQEQKISNLNTIKTSPLTQAKSIHHISIHQSYAYLSAPFGVAVLDLENLEIKATYQNLGETGEALPVSGTAFYRDSLFLATDRGILAGASTGTINLMDFNNWYRFDKQDTLSQLKFEHIAANDQALYASSGEQLFTYVDGRWEILNTFEQPITSLSAETEHLTITTTDVFFELHQNRFIAFVLPDNARPAQLVADQNTYWLADSQKGLLRLEGTQYEYILPEGPKMALPDRLCAAEDQLIAIKKGGAGFSVFSAGGWKNFNGAENAALEGARFYDVFYNPFDGFIYFATAQKGVLRWDGAQEFTFIDNTGPDAPSTELAITQLTIDYEGNLWILQPEAAQSLRRYQFDGQWKSYLLPDALSKSINRIAASPSGLLWMAASEKDSLDNDDSGLLVLNPEDGQWKHLTTKTTGEAGIPSDQVFDLAMDYTGQLWLATADGIAYVPYPSETFSVSKPAVFVPILDQMFPALRDQKVYDIQIDAANRKWAGTAQDLWLLEDEASESLLNFSADSSVLPPGRILDLATVNTSGEVFIATENGLVSYRSAATYGPKTHEQVKIFPNPVPPGFSGKVGISGLAYDAELKITDAAGNLVRELQANGSTASWNLRNEFGQKVKTGIYMVFSAAQDEEDYFVGKIAVVE